MPFEQILKDSDYSLSLFTPEEIRAIENRISVRKDATKILTLCVALYVKRTCN